MPLGDSVTINAVSGGGAAWGKDAMQCYVDSQQSTWDAQSLILAAIGTIGLVKQFALLDEQIDATRRATQRADDYLALAQQTFNDVTLDAYNCQKSLFDEYNANYAQCGLDFLQESKRLVEYDGQYDLQKGRAVAEATAGIDKARLRRARSRGKYSTGECCYEQIFFSLEAARLEVDATARACRYEDERKFALDQWYWSRQSTGAQLVENMRAHVVSGVNSGTTNVSSGLNTVGNAVTGLINANSANQTSSDNLASFFGNLSNGAFQLAGFNAGQQSGSLGSANFGNGVSIFSPGNSGDGFSGFTGNGLGGFFSPSATSFAGSDPIGTRGFGSLSSGALY